MDKESLKEYLSSNYQGWSSFLNKIIFPIFGEDEFDDGYETELLDIHPERKPLAEVTGIRSIKQIGKIYVGAEPLQIFDVTVSDRVMMERNRVNIQRLIRAVMDQYSCAFMLFHYDDDTRWDWRFTYCRKSGNKEESTDSKRYTFLLGPGQSCSTAADNFLALYDKKDTLEIKDIEEAFNVETLSKEFFGKYKAQYEAFVNYMVDPANGMRQDFIDTDFDRTGMTADKIRDREEKPIRDYVKKLLGRIVFLHFLQKKGWLGVSAGEDWGNGDREFMQHLFQNATDRQKNNFLDDILEDLFSEGFDRNRADRGDLYDTEVEGFRNCRIPYLNGGLFERDNLDKKPSHFPAEYFDSLLTMLSQYNFTIDENDPNDAEVGVDPEMLGRIFENLLEDNKDKGAFYTPKEIVQYMCRESLIAYLQTDQKDEDKERIRQFVTTHDAELLGDLKDDIEQKLIEVKICDPAIGSGAFPMGLLRELFFCRSAIEPNIVENAADVKRHIIQNNIYGVDIEQGAVEIARLRFWLSLIVDEKSPEALPNLDFKIMQGNSLLESYEGMDLSKLATMSDMQIYEPQRNLFGEIDNQQIKMVFTQTDKLKEFQTNLKRYFETSSHDERVIIRKSIEDYVRDTIIYTLETQKRGEEKNIELINLSTALSDKQKKSLAEAKARISHLEEVIDNVKDMELPNSKFFLWHTWFHDVFSRPAKQGFDIVIGNPPYMRIQGIRKTDSTFADYLVRSFKSATGSFDLYVTFVETGHSLLNDKGVLSYILPVKWTNSAFGEGLRGYLLDKKFLPTIINFGAYQVFNASTYTGIQMFSHSCSIKYFELDKDIHNNNELSDFLRTIPLKGFEISVPSSAGPWTLANGKINRILNKIKQNPLTLGDVFDKIFQGLATSKDDVYFLYECTVKDNEFIVGYSKYLKKRITIERALVKPLLKGEDVHRYEHISSDRYVIFPYSIHDKNAKLYSELDLAQMFPFGYSYLKECESELRGREKGRFNVDDAWFQYSRKQGLLYGGIPKLLAPEISFGGNFSFDSEGQFYSTTTIYGYLKKTNALMSYETLLAILNSQLCWWFLVHTGTVLANGYYRYKPAYLKPFPIPSISTEMDNLMREKVKKAMNAMHTTERKFIENEIDKIIYRWYNLSEEDVKEIKKT